MKNRGYTLIEVLISLLIFGLIVGLVSYAVSQGLNQYKGVIQKTSNFWEKSKILWLHKSFASTIDYYVKEEEWFPFFEGNSDYITYITESPIAESIPVVAIIVNERKDNGKRRLVYYELPVYTLNYKGIREILSSEKYKESRKIVLIDNLDSVSFEYFGGDINKELPDWYSNFSGKRQKTLPTFLKISFKLNEEKRNFIFTIRNNSNIKDIYNEIY